MFYQIELYNYLLTNFLGNNAKKTSVDRIYLLHNCVLYIYIYIKEVKKVSLSTIILFYVYYQIMYIVQFTPQSLIFITTH